MSDPQTPPPPASGDSSPSLDWLREHAGDATVEWSPESEGDPAEGMFPPEEDVAATIDEDALGLTADQPADDGTLVEEGANLFAAPALSEDTLQLSGRIGDVPTPQPFLDPGPDDAPTSIDAVAPLAAPSPAPAAVRVAGAQPVTASGGVPKLLFILLLSYASAVTLGLLYVYWLWRHPATHTLESLPDVPPLKAGAALRVPVEAPMPVGHTLRLGESRRFGNIIVKALGVERRPVEFAHYSGEAGRIRDPTDPVLRLRLRFTNASADQSIAPVDAGLVFKRIVGHDGRVDATNFVCRARDKQKSGPVVFVYDHPQSSEWDLVDQHLDRVLAPGESFETYIPTTEEDLDELTGDLLWRVHFRKGYSPQGYGVTTLIEVAFGEGEVG